MPGGQSLGISYFSWVKDSTHQTVDFPQQISQFGRISVQKMANSCLRLSLLSLRNTYPGSQSRLSFLIVVSLNAVRGCNRFRDRAIFARAIERPAPKLSREEFAPERRGRSTRDGFLEDGFLELGRHDGLPLAADLREALRAQ